MDYKIISKTEYSGKSWYYIKVRKWFFWKYFNDMAIGYGSEKECEDIIQIECNKKYQKDQRKIRYSSVIKRGIL